MKSRRVTVCRGNALYKGGTSLKIHRILNNNAVVVKENNVEKVVMGSGIAFQKQRKDIINKMKIEKVFTMKEGNKKFQELLESVPVEHIEIAEKIISYAEGKLQAPLSDHIHISLTDHLSFAINRFEQGYTIQNKLLSEIKLLYKQEYEIGQWSLELIKRELNIELPIDEAGHIAIHIHTAKMNSSDLENTLKLTTVISELIEIIEKELKINLDEEGNFYQRMITHLRFALSRMEKKEPFHQIDKELLELIKGKYHNSFEIAKKIARYLENVYDFIIPESEAGYIALHIERIAKRSQ
ncbi:PRD domain-containing protein [Bacillus carboniphilus]|uniref:PRD domain-containing protein n=1 Tax=Bacillus carboniphilus TaxID=86663 RepID=A0ABY9JSM0_9BACI|nr:PRD domain-containing protein [Bacillus carboniphilus]WLR42396.1 PRD domain-containing protein [Bacillus carboniphilus]